MIENEIVGFIVAFFVIAIAIGVPVFFYVRKERMRKVKVKGDFDSTFFLKGHIVNSKWVWYPVLVSISERIKILDNNPMASDCTHLYDFDIKEILFVRTKGKKIFIDIDSDEQDVLIQLRLKTPSPVEMKSVLKLLELRNS